MMLNEHMVAKSQSESSQAAQSSWLRLFAPWKSGHAGDSEDACVANNENISPLLRDEASTYVSPFLEGGIPSFTTLMNYADANIGAHIVYATDEFRCTAANILVDSPAHAWTTRRRRTPGHDWCVIKLPIPIIIRGVEIITTDAAPPHISMEAALEVNNLATSTNSPRHLPITTLSELYSRLQIDYPDFVPRAADSGCLSAGSQGTAWEMQSLASKIIDSGAIWRSVVEISAVKKNAVNYFEVTSDSNSTMDLKVDVIRLNLLPDGGINRLRIYGECALDIGCVHKMKERDSKPRVLDYASAANGAQICYASAGAESAHSLLLPAEMEQSWITPRQPLRQMFVHQPQAGNELKFAGSEFAVIALAARCVISTVDVSTTQLHGDLPYKIILGVLDSSEIRTLPMLRQKALFKRRSEDMQWFDFGTLEDLQGDEEYTVTLNSPIPATHMRVVIIPDGGVTRVRVNGRFYELEGAEE